MLKLLDEEINFIKEYIENSDEILKSNNLDDILLPLDALITSEGFDDEYRLNDFGRKAQRIYDGIYYRN